MAKITFGNKVTLNPQPDIARENKVIDDDINEIKTVVNGNDDIVNKLKGTILWTNSAPTSAFSSQTVTLSSNDYDMLEIYYKKDPSSYVVASVKILKGQSTILSINHISTNLYHRNRVMTYVSDTSYTFDNGIQIPTNGSSLDHNAQYVIPLYIIGYKTGLFS